MGGWAPLLPWSCNGRDGRVAGQSPVTGSRAPAPLLPSPVLMPIIQALPIFLRTCSGPEGAVWSLRPENSAAAFLWDLPTLEEWSHNVSEQGRGQRGLCSNCLILTDGETEARDCCVRSGTGANVLVPQAPVCGRLVHVRVHRAPSGSKCWGAVASRMWSCLLVPGRNELREGDRRPLVFRASPRPCPVPDGQVPWLRAPWFQNYLG